VNFTIVPKCRISEKYDAIVIIVSSVSNRKRRDFHRRTIGQQILIYFIIGVSENDEENREILEESEKNSDVIQTNFIDHYYWLILKTYLKLRWVKEACNKFQPRYVIYFDDDTIIDVRALMQKLAKNSAQNKKPTIYGQKDIFRNFSSNPCSKWFVPPKIQKDLAHLPLKISYVYGYFGVFANGAHLELLKSAKKFDDWIWLEDVSWYGYVRKLAGVRILPWNQHTYAIGFQRDRVQTLGLLTLAHSNSIPDLMNRTYFAAHLGPTNYYELVSNSFQKRNS